MSHHLDGSADTTMMGVVHDALRRDIARLQTSLAGPAIPGDEHHEQQERCYGDPVDDRYDDEKLDRDAGQQAENWHVWSRGPDASNRKPRQSLDDLRRLHQRRIAMIATSANS